MAALSGDLVGDGLGTLNPLSLQAVCAFVHTACCSVPLFGGNSSPPAPHQQLCPAVQAAAAIAAPGGPRAGLVPRQLKNLLEDFVSGYGNSMHGIYQVPGSVSGSAYIRMYGVIHVSYSISIYTVYIYITSVS